MYGPLDMVTLTGEKVRTPGDGGALRLAYSGGAGGAGEATRPRVTSPPDSQVDVHIMMQPPSGEWLYLDTLVTNSSGRVSYTIPETRRLGVGVYPVKMVVRWVPGRGPSRGGGGAPVGADELPPQGRPHVCRQLHHRAAQGHGVRGLQHRWLLRCQCVHHGQRPQSAGRGRGRGAVSGPEGRGGRARRQEAPGGQVGRGWGAGAGGIWLGEELAPPLASCVTFTQPADGASTPAPGKWGPHQAGRTCGRGRLRGRVAGVGTTQGPSSSPILPLLLLKRDQRRSLQRPKHGLAGQGDRVAREGGRGGRGTPRRAPRPQALARPGLPHHLRDGPARHAEAAGSGVAGPAQLPPRRGVLL